MKKTRKEKPKIKPSSLAKQLSRDTERVIKRGTLALVKGAKIVARQQGSE